MNAHFPLNSKLAKPDESVVSNPCQSFVDWMAYKALPLWASHHTQSPFAFVECLAPDGAIPKMRGLRLRVLARQVAVYSQAAVAGIEGAISRAEEGWRLLEKAYWSADTGWAECVIPPHRPTDTGFSLYNQAFAIYAAASWAEAAGKPEPLSMGRRTIQLIDRRLKTTGKAGWCSDAFANARDQNSHMHYLEALLALNKIEPCHLVQSRIAELLVLLRQHLLQPGGAIVEKFGADWSFQHGQAEFEAGHLYEWYWLIRQARDQGFDVEVDEADLFALAQRRGWDEQTGLLYNSCDLSGEPKDRSHRLWPHCEALKAVCLYSKADQAPSADKASADQIAARMQAVFLTPAPQGAWIDRVSDTLVATEQDIPASSLYHLWGAAKAIVNAGFAHWPKDASC